MGEMERLGVGGVRRFEAIDKEDGLLGCTQSHADCLAEMVNNSWDAMMVCEDDASFLVGRRQLDALVDAFLDDPCAEIACLAYNHQRVRRYNSLFLRALETQTTACYVVKASIAPDLRALLEEGVEHLGAGGDPFTFGCDQIWKRLQVDRVFLVPIKRAAYQQSGYSDIERRPVNYGV